MSLLDLEDKIFEDARKRTIINQAREQIGREDELEWTLPSTRKYKIESGAYKEGEVVCELAWGTNTSSFFPSSLAYYVLYINSDNNPEWIRL